MARRPSSILSFFMTLVIALVVVTREVHNFFHLPMSLDTTEMSSASSFHAYNLTTTPPLPVEEHWTINAGTEEEKQKDGSYDEFRWWRGINNKSSAGSLRHPHMGAQVHFKSNNNQTVVMVGMIVNASPQRIRPVDQNMMLAYQNDNTTSSIVHLRNALLPMKQGLAESRAFLANTSTTILKRRSKILCMVYTVHYPVYHKSMNGTMTTLMYTNENLNAVASTWGRECDGFFAASNYTNHSTGAIDLLHEGPEMYKNMWQKIRSMWTYAYDHYLDDYDFFHIIGDDTYVSVDNLRAYVDGPLVEQLEHGHLDVLAKRHTRANASKQMFSRQGRPLLLGRPMPYKHWCFPAGGGGYTLNRAALKLFGQVGADHYLVNMTDSREDVFMGGFFWNNNVSITDTRCKYGGMLYGPSAESGGLVPGLRAMKRQFGIQYNATNPSSRYQISFHIKNDVRLLARLKLTTAEQIYRYHAILNE